MFARAAKLCVLSLLVASIGGQWALLQSIAWTGMLIDYSRGESISAAVCKTFDGRHPCPLCKAIAAGKKSEQKKALSLKSQKLEFPPLEINNPVTPPGGYPLFAPHNLMALATSLQPPTPPPRGC